MMLSIFLPIYNKNQNLEQILEKFVKQTDKDFELVLSLNSPSEQQLIALDKFKKSFKNQVIILINDKNKILSEQILDMVLLSSGEYFVYIADFFRFWKQFSWIIFKIQTKI
ncbi:glycosyltransferase [Mesomycoplasma hyorhinis]|uniref:Glycosyltransferase n=1 Tax=Mesomycoplasma hyorhinis (strain MCLD) TaxID=936139 RepID=A0ABM5M4W1_MESHM|nr:Glycosyltransferase [Mesomycoplasma hyorhinis MCLD]